MDQPVARESGTNALIRRKSWQDRPDEIVTIRAAKDASLTFPHLDGVLVLRIPDHWKAEPMLNIHASTIEKDVIQWFVELGFDERSREIIRTFAPGNYAGASFPMANRRELSLIARYLSLWLLWDDEDVESQNRGFQLQWRHLAETDDPPTNRFDRAWWTIFRELALERSPFWIQQMLDAMHIWSSAALAEARVVNQRHRRSKPISFAEALQSRIATIGMYATGNLVEYAHRLELPQVFHENAIVRRLKVLAGKIVGLGNDLSSLGKDIDSEYVNVVLVLADERSISLREAIRCIARMHDESLVEFDHHAQSVPSFGAAHDAAVQIWLRDLRYACLGFTLWESAAPRYTAFKILVNGAAIEPRFEFFSAMSTTEPEEHVGP